MRDLRVGKLSIDRSKLKTLYGGCVGVGDNVVVSGYLVGVVFGLGAILAGGCVGGVGAGVGAGVLALCMRDDSSS